MEKNANNTKARIEELMSEIERYKHVIADMSEAMDSANDELIDVIEDAVMSEEA